MAPHLTTDEPDFCFAQEGGGILMKDTHNMLLKHLAQRGFDAPCLHRFSKARRGKNYARSQKETRGRQRAFKCERVQKLNSTGKSLQGKARG